MSRYRCRRCEVIVSDPLEHIEVYHGIPSTMAQVWEGFTLVASDAYGRRPKGEEADVMMDFLPFE